MDEARRDLGAAIRNDVAAELSRRSFLARAGAMGLGAVVAGAVPVAERMLRASTALAATPGLTDATLQAFFDTIIPGKKVADLRTELGHPIHPRAILGVDPEHGAVYTDALLLSHNPKIGFDALAPAFLAELEALALTRGDHFLGLDYERRQATCLTGLDFSNPTRVVWEAAAAVPFTAFCAAANIRNATAATAAGYRVMGHPGTAPHGYQDFSFDEALSTERTSTGYLP
jgi:hypothetical protein